MNNVFVPVVCQWSVQRSVLGIMSLVLALCFSLAACDGDRKQIAARQAAPEFSLNRLNGGRIQFPQDYHGDVVAIRFWADWCPYCKSEMKDIEPVYARYRERGFRILAINVRQSAAAAEAFVKPLHISYDVLLDEEGEVSRTFGVSGLPTTFFVGRDGTIKHRIIGEATDEVFERVLEELL